MKAIPGTTSIDLYINYRNSREIADYYFSVSDGCTAQADQV